MLSEQEQSLCITKTSLFKQNISDRMCVPVSDNVTERSSPQPDISDILSYGLKNVKIELPRVNIPNEVIFKNEIEKYIKVFQCKERSARTSAMQEDINGGDLNCSETRIPRTKPELHYEGGLKMSAKILNFSCTKCRSNIRYSPNDLQKHFQLFHHGELPSYPCEMCNFSASDFQSFNQHRRTHRSTLVKCEICNDAQRYTLLDLTKHFTSKHCVNGHFQCEKCRFLTHDVGTFVQHIHRHNEIQYKCDKCHHISFSKEELQKHVVSHTGTFPFSCQYCNYMASRKNYLLKHIITLHRDHLYAKDKMDADNCEKKMKTSSGLKLILKRYKTGASRKALWKRKRITSGSYRLGEEDGQVLTNLNTFHPKSEELDHSTKELHINEDHTHLNEKHFHSGAKSSSTQYNKADSFCSGLGKAGLLKKAVPGPTVLMVKNNKISVPPNYSAKFMGFKMVEGKQHIVIKLLPTDKQNLPAGYNDGVQDGSAECPQQTNGSCQLSSCGGTRDLNQEMPRNNPVHSVATSSLSFSNQYSGNRKQEGNYFSSNTSQTVAPPVLVVEKCATHLPVNTGNEVNTLPRSLMAKVPRGNVSWRNCIPQDHPQLLSSAGTNMLHYDPMKKAVPSEFTVLNGEMNNSSKHNSLYFPSTDLPHQAPLPFHNYSKVGILDKSMTNKIFPLQSSPKGESTACFSQSATELKREERSSSLPVYSHVNSRNDPVFSANQPNYATDRQYCIGNQYDRRQCLNNRGTQVLDYVPETSKQENASNFVNSSFMPKITSVFSLQSNQASSFLSPEINQSLQDVLKVKPTVQLHKYIKTDHNQSFPNNQTDGKTFTHFKHPTVMYSLAHSPAKIKRELNANCSTNESVCFRNESQVPRTSLRKEEMNSASRTTGMSALLKTQTDKIITQQLAKDKVLYNVQGPNAIHPTLLEQKKSVLLQSSSSQFFVPLRLAHQQGLQVVSGKPPPKMNSSDAQASRGASTASFLLNKGPGMILTFGSGSLGTISNATESNSQVFDKLSAKVCGKEAVSTSEIELKIGNPRSLTRAGITACNGAVISSSKGITFKEPHNFANSADSHESEISSMKIHAAYQGSKVGSFESIKHQEIGQEQPVYALLPDGRQAVFLKCMSPNKSLVQNHNVSQGTASSQNSEPKKPEAMHQKLFLKIKNLTGAGDCQPVSNMVSSSQFSSIISLNSSPLEQKNTAFSSSDALLLPGRLIPANACLANSKSTVPFTSVESSKHVRTRSQKYSSDSMQMVTGNKGRRFGSQIAMEATRNRILKPKPHLKETGAKVSDATVSQKNRSLKRKVKDDFWEPPRKKMLHRKCKEKNLMDEIQSMIPAPCRPKVSKDTVRILKLLPFNSKQLVKCPRRNQPVVVLNHPDADAPEVVNVMKTIAKFKGHVLKVSLSKRTIDALLEQVYYSNNFNIVTNDLSRRTRRMLKPVSPVKERFVLKLTLKKTSKNNYQIVKPTSDNMLKTKFSCWFCGRIFDNQDNWVGHGQRHLMEATRDWNSLE